ncbi:hypothetical protein Pan241w_18610 [Gimesia alba]|uniref:YqcC-like domain-containing protein n=1 Tax=Gimesia alba TaxID=2527973 RepID=A0A517RD36_9PLAN|nr:YqcC family protein [Gimesia alba]QDT41797.1 hypothetical protein Pan241w_18610 [Gimesia alba]
MSGNTRSEKDKQVLAKLAEIEAEMKRIEFWTDDPVKSEVTNFMDAPSFEWWLQCVFLPNARKAARKGEYPEKSQVGLLALRQYDYHTYVEEAQQLLMLLNQFDQLVENS